MRTKLLILSLFFCLSLYSQVPTLSTTAVSNITATTCDSGGNITDEGDSPVIARGVCWNTTHNPVYEDNKTKNGSGTGIFTSHVTNLVAVNTYYIRAYAVNGSGIGYGNEVSVEITILSSVPDNEAFSLVDVTDIVSAANHDLVDCFSHGITNHFNKQYYPNYLVEGPNAFIENSLLNFRDYDRSLRPPTDFACVEKTTTSLYWTWVDNSWDEDGFYVERSPDGTSDWIEVETTAADVEGFIDGSLSPNTPYYYRIRAFDGALHSDWVTGYTSTNSFELDDWYLPSRGELRAMYDNLKVYSVGNFTTDYYWSSTQAAYNEAWVVSFNNGGYYNSGKDQLYSVRAICSFVAAVDAYAIRDTGPHGGLIFYIKNNSGIYTYFESKTTDQSVNYIWSNVLHSVPTLSGIGTGMYNTQQIIMQEDHTDSAAKLCNDL
jgi:hypothetical protein